MNRENLTDHAKRVLENKKGYRTELLYGSGERDIVSVCTYEVFEMYNSDIMDTVLRVYADILVCDEEYFLKSLMSRIEEEDEEELRDYFALYILRVIRRATGKKLTQCVWMCDSINTIRSSYDADYADEDFDEIELPSEDSLFILSDIGADGCLVAF